MFDFKRRKLYDTARYEFTRVSSDPVNPIAVTSRHLGIRNSAYVNVEAKRKREPDEDILVLRRQEIEAIASYCIVAWENVTDDGAPVQLTPAKALGLLLAIDEDYPEEIEKFRVWVADLANFGETETASAVGKG